MNKTKSLTEAALLSSLFIVSTVAAIGTGLGYGIYLDFIVPIFFCIVSSKCELKYTILSGISSFSIIFLVIGNPGAAILTSQGIVLGIICGYVMKRKSNLLDDIVLASIFGIVIMVFIDIYASVLTGYSFMKEFEGYVNLIPYKDLVNVAYYLMIGIFPFGMVFSIYYLSLILGKRLNIVRGNARTKLYIMNNFRNCGRLICCSKKVFYTCLAYIIIVEIVNLLHIDVRNTYIKTIMISSQYICYYFVIRDSYSSIQNFIMSKYKKISYVRILLIAVTVSLILFFKLSAFILITFNIFLNKKIKIRLQQIQILDNYIDGLVKK